MKIAFCNLGYITHHCKYGFNTYCKKKSKCQELSNEPCMEWKLDEILSNLEKTYGLEH